MANRFRDCVPGTTLSPEQFAEKQAAKKKPAEASKKKASKKKFFNSGGKS